jgi:site-specific DNA-methyltransferase (adenine-specific)
MIDLIQGDCLELMQNIPDNSIDAIITDPPYGITRSKIDALIPFDLMWSELNRIIKERGAIVLFGNEPFSSALRMSNIKNYKHEWKWDKVIGSGFQIARYKPMLRSEDVIVFSSGGGVNYYPIMTKRDKPIKGYATNNSLSNVLETADKKVRTYTHKNPTNIIQYQKVKGTVHPTQKPVELMEYLIKTYTNESETVLDFTMGSGSTGVACKNLNRGFIGIELDKKYFDIAKKRIEEHTQPTVNTKQVNNFFEF